MVKFFNEALESLHGSQLLTWQECNGKTETTTSTANFHFSCAPSLSQRFTNLLTCQIIIWPPPYSVHPSVFHFRSQSCYLHLCDSPFCFLFSISCSFLAFILFFFFRFLHTLLFYTTFTLSVLAQAHRKSSPLTIWACRGILKSLPNEAGFTETLKYARSMTITNKHMDDLSDHKK